MDKPTLVFDANCYYAAAAAPAGYMSQWLQLALAGSAFELCVSPEILAELQAKLENKLSLTPADSVKFRRFIESFATLVYPTIRLQIVRDPDDNKILECAVQAKAAAVITFDKDLLDLKDYQSIKMVHPRMLKYWFPTS